MTEKEKQNILRWIQAWENAGPAIERLRHEDIRNTDAKEFIRSVAGLVAVTTKTLPPRESSGLVEQQAYFQKAHL